MTTTKKPGPKPKSGLDKFLEMAAGLSNDERHDLMDRGFVLPEATSTDSEIRFVYRCKNCNRAALSFVGSAFRAKGGNLRDRPPGDQPTHAVPWIQPRLRPEQIDRSKPICQHCHSSLFLRMGKFFMDKMIMPHPEWENARDKAYEKIREDRRRRGRQHAEPSFRQPEEHGGAPINLVDRPGAQEGERLTGARTVESGADLPSHKDVTELAELTSDAFGGTALGNAAFKKRQ